MNALLAELIGLLTLERIDDNIFRGPSRDIGTNRVYGGQVLGQALKAAQCTVERRQIHSLHAYFLRKGDHDAPIIYEVDRSRDGDSLTARRVVAIQHGRQIFTLSASFQRSEDGLEYQGALPDGTLAPGVLPSIRELEAKEFARLPEKFQRIMNVSAPFDLRPAGPWQRLADVDAEPRRRLWFKTVDKLPDDADLHRAMLAYVSDYGLLTTTLMPHGLHMFDSRLILASIDHAMWFHRPFRMDKWLLYDFVALSTSNARGLAEGAIYQQDGTLVATTMQEGLIRVKTRR